MTYTYILASIAIASFISCEPPPIESPDPDPKIDPAEPATLLWQTEIHGFDGFGQGITPQQLPNGSIAFIHDGDSATRLYHLNPDNGKVAGSFPVLLSQAPSGQLDFPHSQGFKGTDLLAAYDAYIVKLDLTTGKFTWSTSEQYDYTPTWQPNRYLIGPRSNEGDSPKVYEFDLLTGAAKVILEVPSIGQRAQTSIINPKVFTFDGDRQVLTAYSKSIDWNDAPSYPNYGHIAGYDLTNNEELWRMTLGTSKNAGRSSIYKNRLIQIVQDTVYSLDPLTGRIDWRYWIGSAGDYPQGDHYEKYFTEVDPLIDTLMGYVYLGTKKHLVSCIDINTGEQVWIQEHNGGRLFLQDQGDGMITVLGTDFETYLLDKRTGDLLAKLEQRTQGSVAQTGAYYDSATRRIYLYDGARAYCYQLNFEPPGA